MHSLQRLLPQRKSMAEAQYFNAKQRFIFSENNSLHTGARLLNQLVTYAIGLPNVLAMTTNVNFKLTSSKLKRQGAHVAAEIRHNYTTTQSFLCLQVRDSELQRRGSSPFNLTTPMETQSSTLERGGGHCRRSKLLKKVLL